MIDWDKTKQETGMSQEYFERFPGSSKKVWVICDNGCGNDRWVRYQQACRHSDYLCRTCASAAKWASYERVDDYGRKTKTIFSGGFGGGHIQIQCRVGINTGNTHISTAFSTNHGYELNDEQRRRLYIRNRDNRLIPLTGECSLCPCIGDDTEHHHLWYSDDFDPAAVIEVCAKCHRKLEFAKRQKKEA